MRVSNSRLKTWGRCPNKYRYKYKMGLRPKRKSIELERGSWIHELLMVHYDGEDWRERHLELTKKFNNLFEEERMMLGDLPRECARIMKSYLRHYELADKRFVVVDSELDEIVTLPNGLELHMIVDLILWDLQMEGLWVMDHKSRKNLEEAENIILDPQGTLYYDGLTVMGYDKLLGFCTNEIRTKAPTVPKVVYKGTAREGLSRKKDIDTDVYTYMRAIRKHGFDPRDYADMLESIAIRQKGKFFNRVWTPKDPPVVNTIRREALNKVNQIKFAEKRNEFPRTFDRSCKWGCEFRDICIAELHGGNIDSMVKMNFKRDKEQE